jgi:chromosome segregation ATPase
MAEKDPTKFRIRIDDKVQDTGFEEEIKDRRIEKLSWRITFVSILIPCLIAVILFVAYLDIKKRVGSMQSTGEVISQDMESRISLASEKQAKLEEMLVKKIEPAEKTILSLQTGLKEATTAIRHIRSARKVDNKTLKGSIADIEKELGPVRKDLKNAVSRIKALDKNLADLGKELDKAKNDLNKMQADISLLSSAKIDRKALDDVLNSKQKIYEQKLKQITVDLENKVESIRKRIKKIEMSMPSVAATSKAIPLKKPAEETVTPRVEPQPGTIIEEDIK